MTLSHLSCRHPSVERASSLPSSATMRLRPPGAGTHRDPHVWGMATFRGSSRPSPITASHVALEILGVANLATQAHTPSSSRRCHRHARASALTSAPSGCGFLVGTISHSSGATIRLRPRR